VSRSGEGQSFGFEGGFVKGSCSQGVVRPTGNNQNGVPDPLPRCGPGHFTEGCERFLDLLDEHFVRVFAGEGHFSSKPHSASFYSRARMPAATFDPLPSEMRVRSAY
jgi:hypothetical protein